MDSPIIGVLGIVGLLVFLGLGVHIGVALMVVGLVGTIAIIGVNQALGLLGTSLYAFSAVYDFATIPLFFLMGELAFRGGFAEGAYKALHYWVQKIPGSLAIATSLGCAAFGAVCGASTTTVAVFSKIAFPPMMKHGYQKALTVATIASSATFATMIPPSGNMIVYALFTDVSVGKLFMAGIIPGTITALVYSASIVIRCMRNPSLAPRTMEEALTWREKVASLRLTWPIVVLGVLVLGGIYSGLFTVTESAGIGTIATFIIAVQQRGFRATGLHSALKDTAGSTAMLFLIVIGAFFFARFFALSQIPTLLSNYLATANLPNTVVMIGIFAMYFILGMFINALGMIAITMPVIFPIVVGMGYDPIWFGIIVIKLCEIGFVTPPVGVNVFVLAGALKGQVTLEECFAGVWPFILCDVVVLFLLLAFPQIVLFLPNIMMGN